MAISGLGSYNNALYQWQAQQLKGTGNSASGSSASSAVSSLFGGTASMTSQISSMVELTKYAMDQMGVSSDSRVTFSQITKYRQQLEQEFNDAVKKSIAESGIQDIDSLTFELDKDGKITAKGGKESDRLTAQGWLANNPVFGETLLRHMPADAITTSRPISFSISSTGRMTVINQAEHDMQTSLNAQEDLAHDVRRGLHEAGIEVHFPMDLSFDENGNLQVDADSEYAGAVNDWLKEHSDLADAVKEELKKKGVDQTAAALRLSSDGPAQISITDAELAEVQDVLNDNQETGTAIRNGLAGLGIDKNVNFSIQVNDDGTVSILSDHPDAAKIQQIFNQNPELVKKYRQIETLAGIDDAREAMQVSPSAMRKRIQIESMAAWWAGSGTANSYFGRYSGDSLSLLSGLNLSI